MTDRPSSMMTPEPGCDDLHPNRYFDRIYGLNLDRRPERWTRLRAQLGRFGIAAERFPAVDGCQPEIEAAFERLSARFAASGRRGLRSSAEFACLLSHLRILEDARRRGCRRVLVFEDDACLHKRFLDEFTKIARLPRDWALLYLGASRYRWSGLRRFDDTFDFAAGALGAFAVAYDRSAFEIVLSVWRRLDRAADEGLTEVQRRLAGRCFVCSPNLAIADVRQSDLRRPRHQARHAARMRWDLGLYHLPDVAPTKDDSVFGS